MSKLSGFILAGLALCAVCIVGIWAVTEQSEALVVRLDEDVGVLSAATTRSNATYLQADLVANSQDRLDAATKDVTTIWNAVLQTTGSAILREVATTTDIGTSAVCLAVIADSDHNGERQVQPVAYDANDDISNNSQRHRPVLWEVADVTVFLDVARLTRESPAIELALLTNAVSTSSFTMSLAAKTAA